MATMLPSCQGGSASLELVRAVAGRGLGRDRARRDLERGRQGERAVALVVVGVALDLAGLQRHTARFYTKPTSGAPTSPAQYSGAPTSATPT